MRGLALSLLVLGVFVLLVARFSFWSVFGAIYMIGLALVVMLACLSRRRRAQPAWDEVAECEPELE
jgi:hypothetical protein